MMISKWDLRWDYDKFFRAVGLLKSVVATPPPPPTSEI